MMKQSALLLSFLFLFLWPTEMAKSEETIYPRSGSSAYDVQSYSLRYAINNRARSFRGSVLVRARALKDKESFSLDMENNSRALSVRINGRAVPFKKSKRKLIVLSEQKAGEVWNLRVRFQGRARWWKRIYSGWWQDGIDLVKMSEPIGNGLFFPVNDKPSDAARFQVRLVVPRGFVGLSNGQLLAREKLGQRTMFFWKARAPMPAYAFLLASGKWRMWKQGGAWVAAKRYKYLGALREVKKHLAFLEKYLGKNPYGPSGGLVLNREPYALETAGRPIYGKRSDGALVVHEIAHDWFGNTVNLARWKDIWINEGFAEWFAWYWLVRQGDYTFNELIKWDGFWCPADSVWYFPTSDPKNIYELFDPVNIYWRGATIVELLRREIGNDIFFPLLRAWVATPGAKTVEDFVRLSEERSGRSLAHFYNVYLYGTKAIWPEELMGSPSPCQGSKRVRPFLSDALGRPGFLSPRR